ncbi:MAG: histidine--tRNA ligase [Rhodospirillaceae bacterium]|jgi:histidyl-tRNA synthetase|nr:histidine--tRNA ligase [Rhodospirillaceae bacterium]MBT5192095.1 histidine--tRNA ligase [Rhodospirillaceae bacterium]MBT5898468.1 histidine--tRNA ligase [Rhodospirillaceae bacterium]MBT6429488.1 histidine--tRNA ligase [Rhodospirillaceae bacterium]MBT7760517.1 histidine--tRNA ligase [Rhodospirillaceae bacterium]
MAKIQPVRGTHDIVGETAARHGHVVATARDCARRYGFGDIDIPIFEFTPVFARTMGEGSDVVRKEMYTFTDRGGEDITLRPEFTAGICRAFISGGMQQDLPLKFFAHGPAFRYERPQKGRQRQFHQIDAEILGVEGPGADVEIISLGAEILHDLGILDKCVLELNTLGDPESRQAYRDALVAYFSDHKARLSEDSVDRLARNPLRILDSKDEGDQKIVVDAPLMAEYLNTESRDFFAAVREGLDVLGIGYHLDQRLVRGLDYYTHTAFEFVTDALGSQGAVIAGGRYDGLIKMLGGPPTPGIGWAGGIERLGMLAADAPAPDRPVAFVPLGEAAERLALKLCHGLRRDGFVVDMAFRGNLSRRLKRANKLNARAALILGDDEIAKGIVTLRDLDDGGQQDVALDEVATHLRALIE